MSKKKKILSLSPSTDALLRERTSNASAYVDYAVQTSWRRWQSALRQLEKYGWTPGEIWTVINSVTCFDPYSLTGIELIAGELVRPVTPECARALYDIAEEIGSTNTRLPMLLIAGCSNQKDASPELNDAHTKDR